MESRTSKGGMPRSWRIAIWSVVVALLFAPLVAMQFTTEVQWTTYDFAVAAILLGGSALLFELAVQTRPGAKFRIAIGIAIGLAVTVIWADGAVGIF